MVSAFLEDRVRHDCLVIEGEAGIGKSALWAACVDEAERAHHIVLSARPAMAEMGLGYSALRDLLAPVGTATPDALPEPQLLAVESVLLRAPSPRATPAPSEVAVAFLSVIRLLSRAAPVLVAVDDAQWLDSSTTTVLRYAARRVSGDDVKFAVAARRRDVMVETFADASDPERRVRLGLAGLDLDALEVLVRTHAGPRVARRTVKAIHEVTRGNPFFALQIARELDRDGGATSRELPIPDEVRMLVDAQLRRLPVYTRSALLEVAMLANPTVEIVDEAALAPAFAADVVRFGVAGRIEFSHPLFAHGVYDLAAPARRRSLHARLATLVADEEESARHLARSTDAPDPGVARVLEEAALHAKGRGAPLAGAELMEAALRFTAGAQAIDLARRAVATGAMYFVAGDLDASRRALDAALRLELPMVERCDAERLLGDISMHGDGFTEASRWFETALGHAGDDVAARARILCGLVYTDVCLNDFAGAGAHAAELERCIPELAADPGTCAQSLAVVAMVRFLAGGSFDPAVLARSLELEDRDADVVVQMRPSTIAGLLSLYAGRFEQARSTLWSLHEHLSVRGQTSVYLLGVLVDVERLDGDFDAAARMADRANAAAREIGGAGLRVVSDSFAGVLLACSGDEAGCRRVVRRLLTGIDDTAFLLAEQFARTALGILELSLGRPAEAWDALGPLVARVEAVGYGDPVLVPFVPDAVEALVATGDVARAGRLTTEFEARARDADRAAVLALAARCRGMVLGSAGALDEAADMLEQACVLHEEQVVPFEHARTLLALGRVQRRARRFRRARDSFARAHQIFTGLGAVLWAATADADRDRTHVRQAGGGLTPTEARIARLAAEGLSNREISARLFISQKTVEANLSRVYRKLSIRSRAALGWALTDGPTA